MAVLENVICKCPECEYSGPYKNLIESDNDDGLLCCPECSCTMCDSDTGVFYCETIESKRGDLQKKSQEQLGNEFEIELHKLLNKYYAEGLKKPMMLHKAEYTVVGLKLS